MDDTTSDAHKLIDHLMDYLDSRERPGQQVIVYLDALHPDADGWEDTRTLEDLIRAAHTQIHRS